MLSSRFKKLLLTTLGFFTLTLGVIGIFLPLLPTTVFFLISAWCWTKSSDRFYTRLINNRLVGSYIRNYREEKGITLRQKTLTMALLWLGIGYTALFIVTKLWLTLLLFSVAVGVTIHIVMLKTLPMEEEETP